MILKYNTYVRRSSCRIEVVYHALMWIVVVVMPLAGTVMGMVSVLVVIAHTPRRIWGRFLIGLRRHIHWTDRLVWVFKMMGLARM